MKITRRHRIFTAVVLALAAGLAWIFWPDPLPVELASVTRGSLRVTIDENGSTRIRERYVVSAPLGGQLRRITLHPGDMVKAGRTLVAVIDPPAAGLLDARTRAQLQARVRTAEAQVESTGPEVERGRATRDLAQGELVRVETLSAQRAIARQELDRAIEAARVATEALKSAEYARAIAGFELEQARAALLRGTPASPTEDHAVDLRIAAPVDGRVLRVFQQDAAAVNPGTPLVELGNPEDLEAVIEVLSSDAVRIRPGARVTFEQWGGEFPLEGRVRMVEPAGFLKISALGVEEQRVKVVADFVTPAAGRGQLGDGYRVEARITAWEGHDLLKVPVGSLFREQGAWSVFALRGGRARLTSIELGHNDGREAEILRGLAEGDEVILHPNDKVHDGAAVTRALRP